MNIMVTSKTIITDCFLLIIVTFICFYSHCTKRATLEIPKVSKIEIYNCQNSHFPCSTIDDPYDISIIISLVEESKKVTTIKIPLKIKMVLYSNNDTIMFGVYKNKVKTDKGIFETKIDIEQYLINTK